MKNAIHLVTILLLLAGLISLTYHSTENSRLAADVNRLEAELGRMLIQDADRVHLVEIAEPDVPAEVASHLERVWQFRCYLPPGYDFMQFSGDGRVSKDGVYHSGSSSSSSSWGTASPAAAQELLTVSLQKKDNGLRLFCSLGGSSSTTSWSGFSAERFDSLIIQKLVTCDQGPRSFSRDTILPLLKTYDPSTAEDKEVAGKTITTHAGGLIVLCPKSREKDFELLRSGETPSSFDPSWIAMDASDE